MATRTFEKLVLNQGAADTAILELKSSDVAHGVTTIAETDTYAQFSKRDANDGGLLIDGINESGSDAAGVLVRGIAVTTVTTKATTSRGGVSIDAAKVSGTSVTGLDANGNIATFSTNGTTRQILDSDGDSHQDVGTAWTTFDKCDDVEMLNVLTAFCTRKEDPLRKQFGRWLTVPENRDRLEAMRLATFNDGPEGDGSIFVNLSRVTMLLVGAVRQAYDERRWLRERLDTLEARMNLLLPAVA